MSKQTKVCLRCKKELSLEDFPSLGKGRLRPDCKECHRDRMRAKRRTPEGLLSEVYTSLQRRNKEGLTIRAFFIGEHLANEDFQRAFDRWAARKFIPSEKPIIALDDYTKGYDIMNIRWMNKKDTIHGI